MPSSYKNSILTSAVTFTVVGIVGCFWYFKRKTKPLHSTKQPSIVNSRDLHCRKKPLKDIDLSYDEIIKKSTEEIQKIFQNLLIEAHALITVEENKETAQGIEYLYKAILLAPSSTKEVLNSFMNRFPGSVFELIMQRFESERSKKAKQYFAGLVAEENADKVGFIKDNLVKEKISTQNPFIMIARKCFEADEVVFEERMNKFMVTCPLSSNSISRFCAYCCCSLKSNIPDTASVLYSCSSCSLVYCSEECLLVAYEEHHKFLCNADLSKLDGFAHFMAKYLAMVLIQELNGNSSQNNGPLLHYDFMQKLSVQPTVKDIEEAAVLRSIFDPIHSGMSEFLSDDCYATMKATLMLNAFLLGKPPAVESQRKLCDNLNEVPNAAILDCSSTDNLQTCCEFGNCQSECESYVYCLFNVGCHLIEKVQSSMQLIEPNIKIRVNLHERRLVALASKPIQTNDILKL